MASGYDMEGRVKTIMDTQTFPSGFVKREFVVTTYDSNYPQDIKFETIRDKVDLLESLQENDPVKVNFDIRGNEYQGRFFVNLSVRNITRAGKGTIDSSSAMPKEKEVMGDAPFEGVKLDDVDSNISSKPTANAVDVEEDDLPF